MKKILQQNLIPIFLALITIQSVANNLVHPVTPAFISQLNLHDYMFGVALACMNMMMFVFSFYWADASNKMSMDKILLISLLGYAFGQFLFMNASSELEIIVARLIAGIFTGGFMVGQLNFIVDHTDEQERGRVLSTYTILIVAAATAGYFIGGLLGDISIKIPFMIQVGVISLLGIAYYLLLNVTESATVLTTKKEKINPLLSMKKGWAILDTLGKLLFISIFFFWISNTAFDTSFNYYIKDILNFPPSYNGYLKAIIGIFTLISNLTLTFYLIKHTRLSQTQLRMALLMVLCLSLLLYINHLWVFIGVSLILLAILTMIQPIYQQSVSLITQDKESIHYLMGFFQAIKSLGAIIGSFAAGFVYQLNPIGPFVLALLFMILIAITMFVYERKATYE